MKRNISRWSSMALAVVIAGCAQGVGDISRVQPNVTKKTDLLDGVWYYRNTVTWTPATTGFTFPGQTGNLEKIVFDITENMLIGYRAYPYIPGSEANVDADSKVTGTTAKVCDKDGKCTGGQKYYGAPLIGFNITSHFDIQRNFNPSTGEVGNVIQENSTDRFWYQREFIRVDWSANQLNRNGGMQWGSIQNPAGGSSSSRWIQPNDKNEDPYDWPTWEYTEGKDGKKLLTYFDLTGSYLATPDMYFYPGWGNIPYCYLGLQYDCSSSEIRMRMSFARVDPVKSRDYEPLVYDNDLMSKFGYFRTERLNYDRKFGYNNDAVIRLANRFRTWESSYHKDSKGDVDPTRPIEMSARTVKPIVYYFTPASRMGGQERHDEFLEVGRKLESEWDRAFRRAIAAAKQVPSWDSPVMILCDTPIPEGAPEACGKPGTTPKFGDLRTSWVYSIAEPVANGLLGYGPSSADPETGEIISANANTYIGAVDRIGRQILETMDILLGTVRIADYISGATVQNYIKANPAYDPKNSFKAGLFQAEIPTDAQSFDRSLGAFERPTEKSISLMQQLRATGGLPKFSQDPNRVISDKLAQHPNLEAAIVDNPEIQNDLIGFLPESLQGYALNNPDFLKKAAREFLVNPDALNQFESDRLAFVSNHNMYLGEFFDRTMYALANQEQNKRAQRINDFKQNGHAKCANLGSCTDAESKLLADDEVARRFRQQTWLATSLHEIGHTFGLRHNFQGSYDSINYFDEYWNLRKKTILIPQGGVDKLPRTPSDLKAATGPCNDLKGCPIEIQEQLKGGMYDREYSSIMDYSGKRNGDFYGIGKYDEAAILFAYSGGTEPGYVEVFDNIRKTPVLNPANGQDQIPGSDNKVVLMNPGAIDLAQVNAEHNHPGNDHFTERFHYTTVPLRFGEGNTARAMMEDGIKKMRARSIRKWSDVKVAEAKVADVLAVKGRLDLSDITNTPLQVPYMFCSDDHISGSTNAAVLSCNRFDRGPDYYEISRQYVEDYWNYYFASHFRRDRLTFNGRMAISATISTFGGVANIYRHWMYEFFGKPSTSQQVNYKYPVDPMMQDYWTMAVLDGINQHMHITAVPPAGFFGFFQYQTRGATWRLLDDGDEYENPSQVGLDRVKDYYVGQGALKFTFVPRGLGRRMYSRYDYKTGFGFEYRMTEAGHYFDQIGAIFAAVNPVTYVLDGDRYADQRRYLIPYYTLFRDEMTLNYGSLWAEDDLKLRPTMYLTLNEAGQVSDRSAISQRRWVNGENYITDFKYPLQTDTTCQSGQTTGCIKPEQSPGAANIQLTWTSRIYSLIYGSAFFSVNYDYDFVKAQQVFKLGGSEAQTVAPGFESVEVSETVTGARYVALQKVGAPPYSTPAVRMVSYAADLQKVVDNPAICPMPGLLRDVYNCIAQAQATNPTAIEARRYQFQQRLRDQLNDLDYMRGVYSAFGRN